MTAVGVLGVLMLTVTILTILCIVVPLAIAAPTERHEQRVGAKAARRAVHLIFFAAIGFGFMLVEISQVQRLTIFLGHPVYSLSVVLFSLLLSSGIGSLATTRLTRRRAEVLAVMILAGVLVAFGVATPAVVRHYEGTSTSIRIALSVAILMPLGFFMGMAFPIGMRRALAVVPSMAPWLWGVNGAASVCASVLAVVIALGAGISAAFWVGAACYLVALGALTKT